MKVRCSLAIVREEECVSTKTSMPFFLQSRKHAKTPMHAPITHAEHSWLTASRLPVGLLVAFTN